MDPKVVAPVQPLPEGVILERKDFVLPPGARLLLVGRYSDLASMDDREAAWLSLQAAAHQLGPDVGCAMVYEGIEIVPFVLERVPEAPP